MSTQTTITPNERAEIDTLVRTIKDLIDDGDMFVILSALAEVAADVFSQCEGCDHEEIVDDFAEQILDQINVQEEVLN
jgi:hypothetical protein